MGRVFIVDDDASVLKALSRLMASAGLEWEAYSNGSDFLAAVDRDACGCVLLDYHLKGCDGPGITAALAEKGVVLPVIFLSAHDDALVRDHARKVGAVAFFRKPVDGQALLDAIAWVMGAADRSEDTKVGTRRRPD